LEVYLKNIYYGYKVKKKDSRLITYNSSTNAKQKIETMEIENTINTDYTRRYIDTRNEMSLVIKYLESLSNTTPTIEVTNDTIRMVLKALSFLGDLHIEFHELPVKNAELMMQNHVQSVEIKKLKEQIKMMSLRSH
jgi:hypothetical protein